MAPSSPHLTELFGPHALEALRDGLVAVTGYDVSILDADGLPMVRPLSLERLNLRAEALRQTIRTSPDHGADLTVPIVVDGCHLGVMVLGQAAADASPSADRRAEAVQCLHLIADATAQLWLQGRHLQQRVDQMSTLVRLSTLLAGKGDLASVLNTVAESAAHVMNAKAASIRLIDDERQELVPAAVYNLSDQYLAKGPITLDKSRIDREALDGNLVYVADMATDPRTQYPEDARREGLASILCTGMIYRGRPVGVMRIYSATQRTFDDSQRQLLQALGQLAGAAIANAQLETRRRDAERVQRQVQLAADVQRRMMPTDLPRVPPFDVAVRYEPSFEVGGDFYDVIRFANGLGVVVGDVVGKGVAAGLLMASVRASLRAHAQNLYDINRIMANVNASLTADTSDNEFATVFYGTLDSQTMRLTYSSAGHEPALLLRGGRFVDLDVGGMVVGVDAAATYDKAIVHLQPHDVLLAYTDGVTDASNFNGEKFGRQRICQAVLDMADRSAHDIVQHVLWQTRRFAGLNRRPDDMTILAVKVLPT